MTDRHAGYLVTLTEDIREDDAEFTLNALKMIRGVRSVRPIISSHALAMAQDRRDRSWQDALRKLAADGPDT